MITTCCFLIFSLLKIYIFKYARIRAKFDKEKAFTLWQGLRILFYFIETMIMNMKEVIYNLGNKTNKKMISTLDENHY